MLRVRDDDAFAFEMLIYRHQGKIQRFMQGWVRSVQQCEDLSQDVFFKVYKARKTYAPTAKFTTWLYRIAHNVASNYIRDSSHRHEYQLSQNENESTSQLTLENIAVAPSGFQPTRQMERLERSEAVMLALQALGDRQRTALMLSKFEGMSYIEISETMGLSVKAIKSLLSRARVNIKNILEPYITNGLAPGATVALDDKPGIPLSKDANSRKEKITE